MFYALIWYTEKFKYTEFLTKKNHKAIVKINETCFYAFK